MDTRTSGLIGMDDRRVVPVYVLVFVRGVREAAYTESILALSQDVMRFFVLYMYHEGVDVRSVGSRFLCSRLICRYRHSWIAKG